MSVRHAVPQDTPFPAAPIGRPSVSNPLAMAAALATHGIRPPRHPGATRPPGPAFPARPAVALAIAGSGAGDCA